VDPLTGGGSPDFRGSGANSEVSPAPRRLKHASGLFNPIYGKDNNMEDINGYNNCYPRMDEEESDDWAVAVLTAGFAIGVATALAAVKLIGKLMEK